MIYKGIFPQSQAKAYYRTYFHHEEEINGKMVKFYECFSKDPYESSGPFGEDEEPNPKKIYRVWHLIKKWM